MFNLCRCSHRLVDAPHARPCSYAQMGRCAAVCDGTVPRQDYLQFVNQAVDFLNRGPQDHLTHLQQQMQQAAAQRQYEQAQHLKTLLDNAQQLRSPAFRWVGPLEKFHVLSFQRGPRLKLPDHRAAQPSVSPFIIGPGWITQVEPFTLDQAEPACRSLLDHLQLQRFQQSQQDQPKCLVELLGWVCRLLYRPAPGQGFYVRVADAGSPNELARRVVEHFTRPARAPSRKPKLDTASLTDAADPDGAEPPPTDFQTPPCQTED